VKRDARVTVTRTREGETPREDRCRSRMSGGSGGGEGQNRTDDTQIFSLVLYQLSYLATDLGQLKNREYTMRARP
jgi:hypothetical protein